MNGPLPYMVSGNHSDNGWIVIGPAGYVKHEAELGIALDLCKRMNEQHTNVVRLADALVAQHMRVVK